MNIGISILLAFLFFESINCIETFSALADLKLMLETESSLGGYLKDYISKEYLRLRKLERIAEEFEKHSFEALKKPEEHVSNPINAYKLVKRLTRDWQYLRDELITSRNIEDFRKLLSSLEEIFPDSEDLAGATSALFRLFDTYSLSPLHMSFDQKTSSLTLYESFELGLLAFENHQYYHNYVFFNATLSRLSEANDTVNENGLLMRVYNITKVKLLGYMAFSLYKLGNVYKAYVHTLELLSIDPNIETGLDNKKMLEEILKNVSVNDSRKQIMEVVKRPLYGFKKRKEFADYEKLCRGEDLFPNRDYQAKCQYKRHHPWFFLKPLKEEVLSVSPLITVYHDILSHQETSHVIHLANPNLNRATVQSSLTGKQVSTDYRIGKSAWLTDTDLYIKKMSFKSAVTVNLTLEKVEHLQVLNYGIGGHYEPHYDFSTKDEKKNNDAGNRILTFLCYLSDVQAGGSTVFPKIGVTIKPEKGSCAVFYNLYKDGEGDMLTFHAACPVLIGNKWVANKWFHERGQEFIRPCSLKPDHPVNEIYKEFSNVENEDSDYDDDFDNDDDLDYEDLMVDDYEDDGGVIKKKKHN